MRTENIKSSCLSISCAIRSIKESFKAKKIPVDVFIKTTQQLREIEKENRRIRRAIWRNKYYRPMPIQKICCVKILRGGK